MTTAVESGGEQIKETTGSGDKRKRVWSTFNNLIQKQTQRFSYMNPAPEVAKEESSSSSSSSDKEDKSFKIHTTSSLAKALYNLLEKSPALIENDVKNALSVKRTLSREKSGQA